MAKYLKLTWMADLKAESDFRRMDVPFETKKIKFSQIDLKESQYNEARFGSPIIEALVDDYIQGMLNGDTFPRLVVYATPKGYVLLSGNQRGESIARLIQKKKVSKTVEIEVYLVDTDDPLMLKTVARIGNVGHGGRSTKEERIHNAKYCVQQLGMSKKQAAEMFVVSETVIRDHIKADEEDVMLSGEGVDTSSFSLGTLRTIAKVGERGLKIKLGHLAAKHNPSIERLNQVVSSVVKAGTHDARLTKIKGFEKEMSQQEHRNNQGRNATNGRTKVLKRPRRDRLIGNLTRLVVWLETGLQGEPLVSWGDFQIVDEKDQKEVRNLWGRLDSRMKKLIRSKT